MDYSEEDGVEFTNYTHFKITSELSAVNDEVISILTVGAAAGIAGFLIMCIQLFCKTSIKNKLYCYFNYQHTFSSVLHLTLITYMYYLLDSSDEVFEDTERKKLLVIYHATTYLSLLIPFWTVCVSLKMFADLFLFENGANVYTIKELTKFTYISVLVIQCYEEIVIMCVFFFVDLFDSFTVAAMRLTSILLILAIPVSMLFAILLNCFRKGDKSCFMSVVYLIQLLFLLCSDLILVVFKVRNTKDQEVFIWAELLSARMIFETVWTLLVKSDLPVLRHCNYY